MKILILFVAAAMLLACPSLSPAASQESIGELVLSCPEVSVAISKDRGTVTRITSLKPTPVDVLPQTEDGLCLTIRQVTGGKTALFNRAKDVVRRSGKGYERVTAVLTPSDADMARLVQARVEYTMFPDRFRAMVAVEALVDADGPFEIAFGQSEPQTKYWTYESIPRLWGNRSVPSTLPRDDVQQTGPPLSLEFWMQYNNHPNDVTPDHRKANVPIETIRLPFCIFESSDRYLLWGQMDVNGYLYVAPGHDGKNPCVFRMPKRLSKGTKYPYELTYKLFTKSPQVDYAEVYQWYGQNCYSTNRLTKGIVTIPKDLKPRTLTSEGNPSGQPTWPVSKDAAFRELAKKVKIGHLWDGWTEWDEVPTLDKSWVGADGLAHTEDEARAEIETRHKLGYRCYSYRRQLFPEFGFRADKPWKKDWMLSTVPGTVQVYPQGPSQPDALPRKDPIATGVRKYLEEIGLTQPNPGFTSWVHVDMCNDECRNWYVKALEDWIDKYDCLDGFAFDMGWDLYTIPCIKHPEDGVHHGITKMMADIYRYLAVKHPNMRVLANMAQGHPPNLWAHGVIAEGGTVTTYLDIESVKIYRLALLGYYYPSVHKATFGDKYVEVLYYNMMSNLALGLTIGFGNPWEFFDDPKINSKQDLYSLSAKLTTVPLVIESGAFLVDGCPRREVYRSVFADTKSCYALIFNNTKVKQTIRARISAKYLKPYGWNGKPIPTHVSHFNPECDVKAKTDFTIRKDGSDLLIEGTLEPNELVGLASR